MRLIPIEDAGENRWRVQMMINSVLIDELIEKDATIHQLETIRYMHLEEIAWLKETIRDLKQ